MPYIVVVWFELERWSDLERRVELRLDSQDIFLFFHKWWEPWDRDEGGVERGNDNVVALINWRGRAINTHTERERMRERMRNDTDYWRWVGSAGLAGWFRKCHVCVTPHGKLTGDWPASSSLTALLHVRDSRGSGLSQWLLGGNYSWQLAGKYRHNNDFSNKIPQLFLYDQFFSSSERIIRSGSVDKPLY